MTEKKIHRFFAAYKGLNGALRVTDAQVCHQVARVLKLKPKEQICLVNGGSDVYLELVGVTSSELIGKELSRRPSRMPERKLTVALAIVKKEPFEWAVQKLAELGVSEIQPMITDRTIRLGEKLERWRTIAREAAEIAGWGFVPTIHESKKIDEVMNAVSDAVYFDADGSALKSGFEYMLIGPEGGWTEAERIAMKNKKFQSASLGAQVFRAETAAILGAYELLKK